MISLFRKICKKKITLPLLIIAKFSSLIIYVRFNYLPLGSESIFILNPPFFYNVCIF